MIRRLLLAALLLCAAPCAAIAQGTTTLVGDCSGFGRYTIAVSCGAAVQATVTGASKAFAIGDTGKFWNRSNSGSAMTDTLPAGSIAASLITIFNRDATASDTITVTGGGTIGTTATSLVLTAGRRTTFTPDGSGNWVFYINDNAEVFKSGDTMTGPLVQTATGTNAAWTSQRLDNPLSSTGIIGGFPLIAYNSAGTSETFGAMQGEALVTAAGSEATRWQWNARTADGSGNHIIFYGDYTGFYTNYGGFSLPNVATSVPPNSFYLLASSTPAIECGSSLCASFNSAGNSMRVPLTINPGTATQTPLTGTTLHLMGITGDSNVLQMDSYAGDNEIEVYRTNGTPSSPTALGMGQPLWSVDTYGYDGSTRAFSGGFGFLTGGTASWSTGNHETQAHISLTPYTSSTPREVFRWRSDGTGWTGNDVYEIYDYSGNLYDANLTSGKPIFASSASGELSTTVPTNYPALVSGAPTVSSGFGVGASVTGSNGPLAFRINVGTGGTASTGVIGLPTAPTGWNCVVTDVTTTSAAVSQTKETASTTTTVTVGNYTDLAVSGPWVASDVLAVDCFPY